VADISSTSHQDASACEEDAGDTALQRATHDFSISGRVVIVLLFVAITAAVILTRSPWWDEGQLADPAHTLAQFGYLGSSVMSGKGHPIVREFVAYDRYTFWTMPLYLVVLAGWIKLVGFSFISVRLLSLFCGTGLICAGASLTRKLTGSRLSGMLALLFLATDYTVLLSSATARMDIMVAALGLSGIAAYVALRQRSIRVASLVGGCLAAAASFAHPIGALHTSGLLLVAVFLDRKRLRLMDFALAAAPYVIFAALWGLYIARAPHIFLSQIHAHSSYRLRGLASPLRAIFTDAGLRYVHYFTPSQVRGAQLKLGILVTYWVAILSATVVPALRRAPGMLLLLLLSGLYYVELALLDGSHFPHYMVQVIAIWALLLAAVVGFAISNKLVPVRLLTTVLCGFTLLQISGHAINIWRNTYRNEYMPTINFVMNHSQRQTLVMGPSQLQFGLVDRKLVDDARLGGLTGISPDVIVLDQFHRPPQLHLEDREPDMAQHVSAMLTRRFFLAATYGDYQVYLPIKAAVRCDRRPN
jgi:4-amino-4-deoxy-L-arabinose transferase-like glycosyltransferase